MQSYRECLADLERKCPIPAPQPGQPDRYSNARLCQQIEARMMAMGLQGLRSEKWLDLWKAELEIRYRGIIIG